MGLITKGQLMGSLCPPIDDKLADQLLSEYISQEKRYVLRDWEPATLDGGQFVEAASRILYHQDSGRLDRRRGVNECLTYVEDPKQQNKHSFREPKSAKHLAKVLRTIYKFRSDRGAVHIDPEYTANQLDSRLVIESCKWALSEILRVFWSGDPHQVSKAVREILQYEVPVVGNFEGQLIVQRSDCTTEEEILLLLYSAGESGLSRGELGRYVRKSPSKVTEGLQQLQQSREAIKVRTGHFRLTDLGAATVIRELSDKLLLPKETSAS